MSTTVVSYKSRSAIKLIAILLKIGCKMRKHMPNSSSARSIETAYFFVVSRRRMPPEASLRSQKPTFALDVISLIIVHHLLDNERAYADEQHDHHEVNPCHCRAKPVVELYNHDIIYLFHNLLVCLHEEVDDGVHPAHQENRADHWNGYLPQALPFGAAFHVGSFVHAWRNVLQTGKEDDDLDAGSHCNIVNLINDTEQRVEELLACNAHSAVRENLLKHAGDAICIALLLYGLLKAGKQTVAVFNADEYAGRKNDRQEEYGTHKGTSFEFLVQNHCDKETEDNRCERLINHRADLFCQHSSEFRIDVPCLVVVIKIVPDKFKTFSTYVHVRQTHLERLYERLNHEHEETNDERTDEEVSNHCPPVGKTYSFFAHFFYSSSLSDAPAAEVFRTT